MGSREGQLPLVNQLTKKSTIDQKSNVANFDQFCNFCMNMDILVMKWWNCEWKWYFYWLWMKLNGLNCMNCGLSEMNRTSMIQESTKLWINHEMNENTWLNGSNINVTSIMT